MTSYHKTHASHRKGGVIECCQCYKTYVEDLICQDSKTRLDFCIRCYNRRDINETKETINETLQRRIKESGTRTTDPKRISLTQEMGKIESYFKQEI